MRMQCHHVCVQPPLWQQHEWATQQPNGLNLRTGYSDALTIEDYEERFYFAPQNGLCYLPPVAPPREGCEPVFDYQGLAKASVHTKANQLVTNDLVQKSKKYREEHGLPPDSYGLDDVSVESREWYYTQMYQAG